MSHRVICADCLGPEGLATLADKSVDHVITDPPYEAEAHTQQKRGIAGWRNGGEGIAKTDLSFPPITEAQRTEAARQFARLARRWVVIFCQVEGSQRWAEACRAAGLVYRRTGIWVKPDGMPQFTGDRPGQGYEALVCCHAPGASRWNGGGRHGIWTYPKNNPDSTGHETQKPVTLMEALIRDFTDAGDLVLDPFAGSGSTLVACKRLGRRGLGWEADPRWAAAAQKRIDGAREQLGLWTGAA